MNLWDRRQNSDRWTIFRQSNHGHNTLVIDQQLQRTAGHAKIIRFSDHKSFPHSLVDMTDVYQGQAKSILRGVALLPSREVLIQDELTGLKPGSRVRWGMITPATHEKPREEALLLRAQGARLTLTRLSPSAAAWKSIDTAKPQQEWDSPNRGTRMVAFEAVAPQSGVLTLAVLATPGTCPNSVKNTLKLKPLQAW
jgi:hypothetical protein